MKPPDATSCDGVAVLDEYRGGRFFEIDAAETRRLWQAYEASHESFFRPPTALNRVSDVAVRLVTTKRDLQVADAQRWLESSLETFASLVGGHALPRQVALGTIWLVSDAAPPDHDVWSGECLIDRNRSHPPITVLYRDSLAARIPRWGFDVAWLGALDHFVGHLCPYFQNEGPPESYDETVACVNQHLAAQVRARTDRRFRVAAALLPPIYRLHKEIPLSRYRWL